MIDMNGVPGLTSLGDWKATIQKEFEDQRKDLHNVDEVV